ncbi:FoF1 ATP synthase subunit gamma [Marivita sp. S0852]|uniref:F0F1 ATP synthase subunit gamma n=1 Tax=Marivita sp. S0852 TaxID=3373893 RepID=UPI0039819F56
MAQTLERLTNRTDTMRSLRSIVRTMKTMSAINALPYEQAAQAIEAYRETTLLGFHAFVRNYGPLPQTSAIEAQPIVIVFGSDHGLCGNYNEIVAEKAKQVLDRLHVPKVICIGAQMEDALFGQGISPESTLLPPANADGLQRLSGRLIGLLDQMRTTSPAQDISVTLVFTKRAPHAQHLQVSKTLLPLDPEIAAGFADKPWKSRSLPYFSLPPDTLLAALIRSYLFAEIYGAAAEAMVTENAARLARMQQAERSVDDQLEGLTAEMRSVRQSEITTELLDIIIGFEALKPRDKPKRKNQQRNPGCVTSQHRKP